MRLDYDPETDALYIDLSEQPSVETLAISEGVQLDYDAKGNLVGIDIDNASAKVQLKELILSKLPSKVRTVAA
jgi:YD repeat-containing protein